MTRSPDDGGHLNRLRATAEAKLANRRASRRAGDEDVDAVRAIHELQVHQIELEMQNEELVLARTELEQVLAQFTGLYDFAPVGYFTLGRDSTIRRLNIAGARLFGSTRRALMGRRLDQMLEEVSQRRVSALLDGLFAGADLRSVDIEFGQPGAMRCFLRIDGTPSEDGKECQIVVTDVTVSEKALLEKDARLGLATTAGHVGLWDWDLKTDSMRVSEEWARQIGYAVDEIPGHRREWERRIHPDDVAGTLDTLRLYLEGAAPGFEAEYRFQHRDGSYRHILSRANMVRNGLDANRRVVGAHIDITERVRLEEQFLQSQKMETVGRLAGGIAHDFNNLLTVINGTAELSLMAMATDDPHRRDLVEIRQAGRRAAELTRQLLAFSRKQLMRPEPIELGNLLRRMQGMLQRIIGEAVRIDVVNEAVSLGVFADPIQLEQVVMNLVVNASDAMPSGGLLSIRTSIEVVDEPVSEKLQVLAPGSYVRIDVRDSGIGMDDTVLANAFEPFYTTKPFGKGTGLGLSTVYGIVHQCNGTVLIESTVGKGTTVSVYLPQVETKPAVLLEKPAIGMARGTETLLVVEDELHVRRLACRILGRAGYHVIEASNGAEALAMITANTHQVDLVITDIVMPGMTGWELGARLAADYPKLKVMYTSGYAGDFKPSTSVDNTNASYLAKPYAAASLTEKVREILDR